MHGNAGNDTLLGGAGADRLFGGAGDDILTGSSGDDTLDGGDGVDTAIFSGDSSQYIITRFSDDRVEIAGPDGTDTLVGINFAQFDDKDIQLLPAGSIAFDEAGVAFVNDELIDGDVRVRAEGVTFTNTAQGEVSGTFTFTVGGSTLINELGGVIADPDFRPASGLVGVQGSDGNDTLVDGGTIKGTVDLGEGRDVITIQHDGRDFERTNQYFLGGGNDILRLDENSTAREITARGGEGFDVIEIAADVGFFFGLNVREFEVLRLQVKGVYSDFSGLRQISGTGNADDFFSLFQNEHPEAEVNLGGSLWQFTETSVRSILASDSSNRVNFASEASVAEAINLAGGDDRLALERGISAASVVPSIDGGEGTNDTLVYRPEGSFSEDLSTVSGFEHLIINSSPFDVPEPIKRDEISNANGFTDISSFGFGNYTTYVVLVSGNLSSTTFRSSRPATDNITSPQGSLELSAGLTLGAYTYAGFGAVEDRNLTQGDSDQSSTLLNKGTILGDAVFGAGNDTYDGTQGTVNGQIFGNAGDDTLTGGTASDRISGGFGEDSIDGGDGNDVLDGDDGDDTINGGAGDDTINGGAGDDTLNGDAGIDQIFGGAGNDLINGGDDMDIPDGGDDDDEINGDGGSDIITGGNGNDTLNGGDSFDELYGGAGDDILNGGASSDLLEGGEGNDQLFGGDNNDQLLSTGGSDFLSGDAGGDLITINHSTSVASTITVDGGTGDDTVSIDGLFTSDDGSHTINADLGEGDDTVFVAALASESLNITGGAGSDRIWLSSSAVNQVFQRAPALRITDFELGEGGDFLQIRDIVNLVVGSTRNLSLDVRWISVGDDMLLQAQPDTLSGFFDLVLLEGVQFERLEAVNTDMPEINPEPTVTDGTAGNDTINGTDDPDLINGFAGNDTLGGGRGNDILNGDEGEDVLRGDDGNDTLNGGSDNDTLLGGTGNDTLNGGDGDDVLQGEFWPRHP